MSNKNEDIVTKRAGYCEESDKRNLKYYNRKIVEDKKVDYLSL